MPSANPFVQTIELGGSANVGPVSSGASLSLGTAPADNHVSAGLVLLGIALLILLWKSKFRFSTTVG